LKTVHEVKDQKAACPRLFINCSVQNWIQTGAAARMEAGRQRARSKRVRDHACTAASGAKQALQGLKEQGKKCEEAPVATELL